MHSLFTELDLIDWNLESFKEKYNLYDEYLFELVDGCFLNLPEKIDSSYFTDIDYLDYCDLVAVEHKKILNEALKEMKELRVKVDNLIIIRNKIRDIIGKLSTLSREEVNYLLSQYGKSPINLDFKQMQSLTFFKDQLRVAPLLKEFSNQDFKDFLKYLVDTRFNRGAVNVKEAFEDYSQIKELPRR